MNAEPTWRRYLRFFGFRGVADLDDELRFHVEMRVQDYMAQGLSEADARAATARRLGDLANSRDACVAIATRRQRKMSRARIVDALTQDVRFALRTLGRQKGWTLVAGVTLALGIGASTAMFSVVNHLLLNPLPYPGADRVVAVFQQPSEGNNTGVMITITPMGRLVAAWKANTRSFEALEPFWTSDVTFQPGEDAARVVHVAEILPTFAPFAGQRPIIGRMFTEAEAKGEASVVLLSEGLWRSQYGARREIVGSSVTVNEKSMTIIGVMPGGFQLPRTSDSPMDLWLPLDLGRRDDDGLHIVARLRPGVTTAVAMQELDEITRRTEPEGKKTRFATVLARPGELVRFQDSLVMLSVAVALVLLIACANVAHLLLARASTRQREMAIRAALGAGAARLFRQLLTESLILSAIGCVGGLAVGWAGLRLLVAARPESLGDLAAARMDGATLLLAAALAAATGLAFGVIGAFQASRHSTHDALKGDAVGVSTSRARGRGRRLLVVTEMAFCTMLLVGAALLLRSVRHLQQRDAGFEARGLYAVDVDLPRHRYDKAAIAGFFDELTARAAVIPGVVGITRASAGPPSMSFLIGVVQLEGQPEPRSNVTAFVPYNGVGPEFFKVMGIRLVEGTVFTDTSTAAAQAIVNEGFARKHWPRGSAIGRKIRVLFNGQGEWKTVVGVVQNALTQGLARDVTEPLIYMPGTGVFRPTIIVRTAGDASVMRHLGALVASLDSRVPPRITSVELAMQKSIARPRFTMFLLLVFTVIAVGLAAIGLYGVLAYSVAQRTREIGIRMALGATRRTVAQSVFSQGLLLAGLGAIIGLLAARWGVKLLSITLYGVQGTDAASFALSATVLVVVAATACLVPVRRALRVDPVTAIRAE